MDALNVRADGSEMLQYNAPDFPLRTAYSCLSFFADYAAGCHWHQDYEALIALDGEMDYQVNGQSVHLGRGDAIFVNSRRLHYGYSAQKRDCNYCFAVFHPDLFGVLPAIASMLEDISMDPSPDYWLFSSAQEQDVPAIQSIRFLCDHAQPEQAFALQAACARLMDEVYKRAKIQGDHRIDPEWTVVRAMAGYIQGHYRERILLEEIAAAGAVCRSRCCQLFRQKLHTTPMNYVTDYRLKKACDLIRSGAAVTDAAFSTGFQSVSYFSETFRKVYGFPPSVYMKQASGKVFA